MRAKSLLRSERKTTKLFSQKPFSLQITVLRNDSVPMFELRYYDQKSSLNFGQSFSLSTAAQSNDHDRLKIDDTRMLGCPAIRILCNGFLLWLLFSDVE